jgi:bifunctional DNase/RNase
MSLECYHPPPLFVYTESQDGVTPHRVFFLSRSLPLIPSVVITMPNLVPMQLARIIKSDISENQVIYLKEVDGDRQFPILIGYFEATSIDLRVTHAERPARPLTHDLIVGVAESLGAKVECVIITELKDQTYFAVLRLKRNDEPVDVDARPSDAIAVAVSFQPPLPILVASEILEKLGQ